MKYSAPTGTTIDTDARDAVCFVYVSRAAIAGERRYLLTSYVCGILLDTFRQPRVKLIGIDWKEPSMVSRMSYVFSGHQTFVLRASWLKRLYDELTINPHVLTAADAVVRLGVGKNMVDAMRYWGVMTQMITVHDGGFVPTALAHTILADDGLDPFLVTPWARWLLHWQLIRSDAFTWRYVFMRMNGNDIVPEQVVRDISSLMQKDTLKIPASEVLRRDISCVLRCYLPRAVDEALSEDFLLCPFTTLQLMQPLDDGARLTSGARDDLPDGLVMATIADAMQRRQTTMMPFSDLMWSDVGPGRMFRLSEDALLDRVARLELLSNGAAAYSDHGGVRAVQWREVAQVDVMQWALRDMHSEVRL